MLKNKSPDHSKRVLRIDSASNPRYRHWKKLTTAHGRKKEKEVLLESRKVIADAMDAGITIHSFLIEEHHADVLGQVEAFRRNKKAQHSMPSPEKIWLPTSLFDALSSVETPDGILAVAERRIETPPEKAQGRILLLDHLQDPGNMGAILRSAEAMGFASVFGLECVDYWSPKVLRSAMGAVFRLDLHSMRRSEWKAFSETVKPPLIGADLMGVDVRVFAWPESFVLVIGSEGRGISDEVKERLDAQITIPMQGKTESLNAAVSASILMASASLFNESRDENRIK